MDNLWLSVEDFLKLFSVDITRNGARDFIDLTEMYSVQLMFPELEVSKGLLVRMMLRDKRVSPMVFWSRMKRDLMPILSAESDTLASLGCPLAEEKTCSNLVDVLAAASAGRIRPEYREKFRYMAEFIKKMCND